MNWHKEIFEDRAWNNHNGSEGFRNNWLNNEHRRFYEETVYNHFTIQFGFILLLQLIFIVIFVVVKALYGGARKKMNPDYFNALSLEEKTKVKKGYHFWKKINDLFDMRFLYSVFMFFIIEVIVFTLYNFHHKRWDFDHGLYIWSIILAIIYFILYILLWVWNYLVAAKPDPILDDPVHKDRWGFVYEGLERTSLLTKIFQFIQYTHYLFFALFLTVLYPSRRA